MISIHKNIPLFFLNSWLLYLVILICVPTNIFASSSVYVQNNTYLELTVGDTQTSRDTRAWKQGATKIKPGQRAKILEFDRAVPANSYFFDTTLSDGKNTLILKQQLKGKEVPILGTNSHSHMWQSLQVGNDSKWCTHAGSKRYFGDFNGDGRTDLMCKDTQPLCTEST